MYRDEIIKKISNWYFTKRVLPYWAILLADTIIVFVSAIFIYWVTNRTLVTFEHRFSVLYSSLLFAVISWVGARCFKTYAGVLRFSSTVDLLKLAYANTVSLVLAIICVILSKTIGFTALTSYTLLETVAVFLIATLLMWALRIIVKVLYESANSESQAMRVLIYGALTGGIGLAKSIRSQKPLQYDLVGFISHEQRIKNMKLLGVPVYTLEDDIAGIVKRDKIQGVLISPLRINEFRKNQSIQDILIGEGCKILMTQDAREVNIVNGEISEDEFENVHLKEVSVEDLLPRSEIKVDLKSVEELLTGRRVLITGAAGSIGMEIVRQVAQFKPAKLMLIDQAETPQHDVTLMMAKDFPEIDCEVVVTSISRRTRMDYIFESFRPEYVFHAAAYKHVPMMKE